MHREKKVRERLKKVASKERNVVLKQSSVERSDRASLMWSHKADQPNKLQDSLFIIHPLHAILIIH